MSVEALSATVPETIGPYIFQELLGTGGFSVVYSALHETTKTKVAIKVIPRDRVTRDRFERELLLMKKLDHPFIIAFYDFLEDAMNYYLVMEYCNNGTLRDRVTGRNVLPETTVKGIICELISALDYLHNDIKIAHRDIKLENIVLDQNNHIRLIDFGLGHEFSGTGACLQTACGSPVYASPEMLSGQKYGTASDVWSAGVVLYALTFGYFPFQSTNLSRLVSMILYDEPQYDNSASPALIDLMKRMLSKDVDLRITVQQMRMHGWLFGDVRAKTFGPRFGLEEGWRFKNGCFCVSEDILTGLRDSGVGDIEKMREELSDGVFNSRTALYRMERRKVVMNGVNELEVDGRFEKRAGSIPRPIGGKIPAEMRQILQKMKENRHEDGKSLPPLSQSARSERTKLAVGAGFRTSHSMNPRQTQAVVSIVSHLGPIKMRTRALSSTARHAPVRPVPVIVGVDHP